MKELSMSFNKGGVKHEPLKVFELSNIIVAVYKGRLSQYDILVKYRQNIGKKWTAMRTPKHIHWAVDLMIKRDRAPLETKKFLEYLVDYWDNKVEPIKNEVQLNKLLSDEFLEETKKEAKKFEGIKNIGEYDINFLLLLAKLLMHQEKTNYSSAYMFKNLLKELKDNPQIYKIISIATQRRA